MSKQKKYSIKRFISALTAVLILVMSFGSAFAAENSFMPDIDPAEKGTLKITLSCQEEQADGSAAPIPVPGGMIEIYKVADLSVLNGSATYTLTPPYQSTGIEFAGMTASESNDAAAKLAAVPNTELAGSGMTDAFGVVTFTELSQGMYLIVQNAEKSTQTIAENMAPFLMMVPYPVKSENGNTWNFNVETDPKLPIKKLVPGDGEITVTKKVYTVNGDTADVPIVVEEGTFYVALFDPENPVKKLADQQPIYFKGQQSSSVTFTKLELDRSYLVAETDANGAPLPGTVGPANEDYYPVYPNGQTVEITKANAKGELTFHNVYPTPPNNDYYEGELTITKETLRGDSKMKSKKTFYAGIFTDKELTTLYGNVVKLKMNGKSSASVTVKVNVSPTEATNYYVTETDKNGKPLDNSSLTDFQFTVSNNGVVQMSKDQLKAGVVITNTFPPTDTPPGDTPPGDTPPNDPPKTGDETPLAQMIGLFAGAGLVLIIAIVIWIKRRKKNN